MGKRGPKPTPTEILKRRGSWRGNLNPGEPTPEVGAPDKPDSLTEEQSTVWDQVVPLLVAMRCVSPADFSALERYCVYFVRWRKCEAHIQQYGLTYQLRTKSEPKHYVTFDKNTEEFIVGFEEWAEAKEGRDLDVILRQLESMFGLTPSSRSRISVPSTVDQKSSEDDEIADILRMTS